jgi:hypothetical protein
MSNDSTSFIKASHDVIEANGLETVKRWANDPNKTIADMFMKCLEAAEEQNNS